MGRGGDPWDFRFLKASVSTSAGPWQQRPAAQSPGLLCRMDPHPWVGGHDAPRCRNPASNGRVPRSWHCQKPSRAHGPWGRPPRHPLPWQSRGARSPPSRVGLGPGAGGFLWLLPVQKLGNGKSGTGPGSACRLPGGTQPSLVPPPASWHRCCGHPRGLCPVFPRLSSPDVSHPPPAQWVCWLGRGEVLRRAGSGTVLGQAVEPPPHWPSSRGPTGRGMTQCGPPVPAPP